MYTVVRKIRKRPPGDRDVGCGVEHGALGAWTHGHSTNRCPSVDDAVRLILDCREVRENFRVHSGIGMSGENVRRSCTAASSMSGGNIGQRQNSNSLPLYAIPPLQSFIIYLS